MLTTFNKKTLDNGYMPLEQYYKNQLAPAIYINWNSKLKLWVSEKL